MDFLNKAFAQVAELFRSMTPAARITAGLLLAVVMVSVGYLFNHQVTGGDAYLLEGQHFSQPELNAMEAAFGKAGLGNFEFETGRVRVPRGLKAKYMAALADAGAIPAHFGSYLDAALNKPSPFTSKAQQDAMLKNAKQRELAAIIGQMRGIETAAVFYDVEKKGGLKLESSVTASVSVKPVGTNPMPSNQVPNIRAMVASAIAGLKPEQVAVVDLNGPSYRASGNRDVLDVLDDPYAQRVKMWQEDFEQKIAHALEYVPGVVVTAYVELDLHTKLEEEKTHVDPKTVPITVQEETQTDQSDAANPSGQPGLQAQRANAPATLPAQARGSHTEKERSSRRETNDTSRDYTKTETAPLTPKRVTVAVSIPSSYFEKVYRDQNPSSPDQPPPDVDKKALAKIQDDEIAKIQKHITALLPQTDLTSDPRPLVTVTPFYQLPMAVIPGAATSEIVLDWLAANWSTAGMTALALVSLVMLRSMARAAPVQSATPELPLPAAPPPPKEAPKDAAESTPKGTARLKRRLGSGQSLRDELADMVREDPDTAASILQSWIGSAS